MDILGDVPTLSFDLPYIVHQKRNFRWDYIKAEHLVRLIVDNKADWFIIDQPDRSRERKRIGATVNCSHLAMQLKTKNIYMTFDDTNGIDTLPNLIDKILKGTLWSFDSTHSDVFVENDDPTREKVRSLQSDGKEGALQLIVDVCNLFDAYPVYDGDARTVAFYTKNHFGAMRELQIGKNINSLDVKYDSSNIITRLYVEGTYDEDNYLTISSVNPTGLSYLQDFSYYKELGLFTAEHEAAEQQYYEDMAEANEALQEAYTAAIEKEDAVNRLWGQVRAVYYPITNGALDSDEAVLINETDESYIVVSDGDTFIVEQSDHTYRDEVAPVTIRSSDLCAVKFITLPAGMIGARQVSVEAKEQLLAGAIEDLDKEQHAEIRHDDKIQYYQELIASLQAQISEFLNGTTDEDTQEHTPGLYELMWQAIQYALELEVLYGDVAEASQQQDLVEATFAQAMGDMLREGYRNDENYVEGQEQALYNDSLEAMRVMSRPAVTYTFDYVSLAGQFGMTKDDLQLNMQMHVYDKELGVNDILHISKITRCYDDPSQDDVEVSNEDLTLTGGSLDSVLGRMAQLANLLDQKNALYRRASAINADGSILMERLEGQINIIQHKLLSERSSWYTDDNGAIIFESSSGESAMMLTGEGYMIANGKRADGSWNWRTKQYLWFSPQ